MVPFYYSKINYFHTHYYKPLLFYSQLLLPIFHFWQIQIANTHFSDATQPCIYYISLETLTVPPGTRCCRRSLLNNDPTCVQRQHYLRRGGSAQPVKRHCGIASITAPRSPFSGILKLGSGERRRRRRRRCPLVFLCGDLFRQLQTFLCVIYFPPPPLLTKRPSTCPDGPFLTRKGLHFLVLHDVSWSS